MTNIDKTIQILETLEKKLLPIKGTGLSVKINANIKLIRDFLTEVNLERDSIIQKYLERDSEGNIIEYEYSEDSNGVKTLVVDSEGNAKRATSETLIKGGKIDVNNSQFQEEMSKLSSRQFDSYSTVLESQLSFEQLKALDGVDFSNIIGTIIV